MKRIHGWSALTFLLLAAPTAAPAQTHGIAISAAQIERGEKVFKGNCSACHTTAHFTKAEFTRAWDDRPIFELYDLLKQTMPEDFPGTLAPQEYLEVTLYLYKLNGTPDGGAEIPVEESVLKQIRLRMKIIETARRPRPAHGGVGRPALDPNSLAAATRWE